MALTTTSISADIGAGDIDLPITSTSSGFPGVGIKGTNQVILIDGEYMLLDYVIKSGLIRVKRRGDQGTYAQAHDVLAQVTTSSDASDFPAIPPGMVNVRPPSIDNILSIGENGTIAVPSRNTTYLITKATALATTVLDSPTVAQNGLRLTFTSETAAAHVITGVLEDGTTGGSTTATFAAFKGASFTLVAANGVWNVVSTMTVTIT